MAKPSNEELFEKFKSLPKDIQDAILKIDTSEIIREIGEKYKLMIDKIGELADETGLVMLGFTHPSRYVSHLSDRLEVDKTVAKEIAEEINSKVFFPIRENLKKIHGVEKEAEEKMTEEASVPLAAETPPAEVPPSPAPETAPSLVPEITPVTAPTPGPEIPTSPMPEAKPPETPSEISPLTEVTIKPEEIPPGISPISLETPKPPEEPTTLKTPPIIMAMPMDLSKAQKAQAETAPDETHPIFEAKTKEETFRSPIQVSEKTAEIQPPKTETKMIDPYREQVL